MQGNGSMLRHITAEVVREGCFRRKTVTVMNAPSWVRYQRFLNCHNNETIMKRYSERSENGLTESRLFFIN